ncbi:MAG: hypothetical protein RIR20_998 [Pseudomonadota bacterium]
MSKLKSLNFIGLGLLIIGTNAYAACTINNINNINVNATRLWSFDNNECNQNYGTISATNNVAMFAGANNGYVTNSNYGEVSVIGDNTAGLYTEGPFSLNINYSTGNILISGTVNSSSSAMSSNNNYSSNINYGIIRAFADIGRGLYSHTGIESININFGTIINDGTQSYGIHSFGPSASNTNFGTITSIGSFAYGIYSSAANTTNSNSGTISTSGENGYGIRSNGNGTITYNSGSISTSGQNASGIFGNTSVFNSGMISTSGFNASGISINSGNRTITNTGTIITTGNEGHGVILGGNNITLNNFGLIKATGIDSNAIRWSTGGSNGVVNLNRGSVIVGNMVAGDHVNPRLNINLGSGASYAYSVSNHIIVTDLDNRPMVTGSAYAAGIGAQETASEMLYQRTSVISSSLDRRLRSYAADEVESQPYWLDVYYADVTRNSGGNFSTQTAFSNHNYGMTAGFKLPVQFTPLELVVNVEQNNLNIDSGNQRIDSSSIMAGFLAPSITEVLGAKLSAKALVGYADHDGDRKVMINSLLYDGSRQIKSDYNSTYAVLGTALTKLYPITNRLTADVILGLDLNTQRFESYKETDYFAWDSRTLTQLQSRVQTGLDYKLWGDKGSVFARVGAEHRDLIGGATQDYAINGTNVSFNTNNKNDTYLTAQVGVRAQLEKRIQLFGIVNTLHSSDSVNSVSGNIALRADF